jgi:hypothetical protein
VRDVNGSGRDGVDGAARPGPDVVIGDGDIRLYADETHVSQAQSDENAASWERVHKLVEIAVERVRKAARWQIKYGWDARSPQHCADEFKWQFRHLMVDVRGVEHRAYIKKRFIRLWKWLGDKSKHKRCFPIKLRDQLFERGELRAYFLNFWPKVRGVELPPELAAMERHQGTDRFAAFFISNPHLVEGYLPFIFDSWFPRDLAGVILEFIPLAIECNPNKLIAFWNQHRNILGRLMEPLIREAQARVDALNAGKLAPEEPPPEVTAPAAQTVVEEAPSMPSSLPPDEDALSFDELRLGVYRPNLPDDLLAEYMDAIAGLSELDGGAPIPVDEQPMPSPAAPLEIVEEVPPLPAAAIEHEPPTAPDVVEIPPPPPPPPPAMIDVAFGCASVGWPVFPCDPKTKHPLTPRDKDPKTGKPINGTGGFKKATTDHDTIREMWTKRPDAMVGIPTGEAIDAFVLDIDIADKDGNIFTTVESQIAAVEAELGVKLPPTYQIRPPRGGAHLYFGSKHGFPRNAASIKRGGKQLVGIDVRGDGGYVIAAGSIRHDGRAYVLVEDREIAQPPIQLVDWACGRGRWAPEQAPPPESTTTPAPAADSRINEPSRATSSSKLASRGAKSAAKALERNTAELAAKTHPGRNDLTNRIAYRMGHFVGAGWIGRDQVFDALLKANEANGKIRDDGGPEKILATIESGLDAGIAKPFTDLPDRRKQSRQRADGDDDMWRRRLRSEARALFRLKFPYATDKAVEEADARVAKLTSMDRRYVGIQLQAKFTECQELKFNKWGRRKAGFPSTFLPFDETDDVVKAWLKAEKRKADKTYQAKQRAKEKLNKAAVNDLDDRESAVLTFLRNAKGAQPMARIMKAVGRSRAFSNLKGQPLRNAILRLLAPGTRLHNLTIQTMGTAKNGKPTMLVEARP